MENGKTEYVPKAERQRVMPDFPLPRDPSVISWVGIGHPFP
jgi:hypothetical protein